MTTKPTDEKFVSVTPARYPCDVKDKRAAELVEKFLNWRLNKRWNRLKKLLNIS